MSQLELSDLNDESERVRLFQKHRRQFSDYKPLDPLSISDPNAQSRAYCITIPELKQIPYKYNQAPLEFKLRIVVHIYCKKEGGKQKGILGNTFTTVGLAVEESSKYVFNLVEKPPPSIYFHANIVPEDQIYAIFNIFMREMDAQDILINQYELGVGEVELLKEGDSKPVVRKTVFNQYMSSPASINSCPDLGAKLTVNIQHSPEFEKAKHLIPMMYLVDTQSIIHGLEVDPQKGQPHLPFANQEIHLQQNFNIHIEQVEIRIPEFFEQDVLKCAQQYLMQVQPSSSSAGQQNKNININAIHLSCAYHNTRTCVNSEGNHNKLVLKDTGRQPQEEDGKTYQFKVLKFEGSHQINNVFASENAMLTLQLEYSIILSGPQSRFNMDYIVGYLPVFVSDKFGIADLKLSDTLMIGGSKSIDNKLMMKFSYKLPVYIVAKINLQEAYGGISVRDQNSKSSKRQQASKISEHQDNSLNQSQVVSKISAEPEEESKINNADMKNDALVRQAAQLQQIQREIEEKEKQISESHRPQGQKNQGGRQQQQEGSQYQSLPLANTREMQEIIQNYETKLVELQKTILLLKEENTESKNSTAQELNEIKQMLGDMKRPKTQFNTFSDPFVSQRAQNEVVITNEDDKKRWEILETLVSVPKMKSNYKNTRAFSQQPASGAEIISNADKVYLVSKGVKGLLDETRQMDEEAILDDGDFIAEYNDKFQASVFTIKIVAFKSQISNFEDHDQMKKDSIFSENFYIPEKMHFTFNFFEFEDEKTESYSYDDAGQVAAMKKLLTDNRPVVLETVSYLTSKSGPQQRNYNFKIDPSIFYPNVHAHFVDYLFKKSLHFDIWDSDNLMLYGSSKVPLRSLLRQGRQSVEKQINVPIIDTDFCRERGRIFLVISNQGYEPQTQEVYNSAMQEKLQANMKSTGFGFSQSGFAYQNRLSQTQNMSLKKKVRSENPITLDEVASITAGQLGKKASDYFSSDPIQRQRERIRRFKIKNLTKEKGEETDASKTVSKQEEQMKKISDIQIIKEEKKGTYIKSIISNLLKQEIVYDIFFGKMEFIEKEVINNSSTPEIYLIHIEDPDEKIIGYGELSPMQSPEEWRFFIDKHGTEGPSEGNFFNKDDKGNISFLLAPGQKITLIFKFLTFREIDPHVASDTNVEEYTKNQSQEYFLKYINTRTIDVHITGQNARNDNQGFKFVLRPHRQVVDHVFRYYERENKQVQLILPALYSDYSHNNKPSLYSTNSNIQYEWLGDNEVSLQLRVPQVGRITRFNILAYQDTFFHDLLANWEIEVHSLEGLDIKIGMGQSKQVNLAMNSDTTRMVKFYSSLPLSVWFNEPFDRACPISQGKVNQIGLTLRSFSLMKQSVQVNCVDQNSKELLYSWIIRIDTEKPVVSKMYDLKIPVKKETHIQKFTYQNRTANESSFTIESSQIELIQVVESRLFLSPGEKTQVKIRIPTKEQPGIGEVFLFITDDNERVECILFKLHYFFGK